MILPTPKFEPILINLKGLGFFSRLSKLWKSPPRFRIIADWVITLDDGLQIIIPQGFETDFASIPRLFWAIPGFSPDGPLLWGAILHDFGYQYGYLLAVANSATVPFPDASVQLQEQFPSLFCDNIPVYVGFCQGFYDNLLRDITLAKTGAKVVAESAQKTLALCGGVAWGKYRKVGPTAYNINSLGLPGITENGVSFL